MRGDEADRAEALERRARERGVAAASAAAAELHRPRDPEPCEDCGEQIEAERRRAVPGARRCVECQAARERRQGGLR